MTQRAFYINCSLPFWLDTAAQLQQECGWQPVYWVATPDYAGRVQQRFPGIVFHSLMEAVRGIPPAARRDLPTAVLDQPTLEKYAYAQAMLLKMMDRIDALDSFTTHERTRLYWKLMMYWAQALDDLQPDVVVFCTIPHIVYDYVLYQLCKERGIRTVAFESTPMQGRVFVSESFDAPSEAETLYQRLLAGHRPGDPIPLAEETVLYLAKISGRYDDLPKYMRRPFGQELPQRQMDGSLSKSLKKLAHPELYREVAAKQLFLLRRRVTPPFNYLKQKGKTLEQSWMNRLEYDRFRSAAKRKVLDLLAYYEKRCTPVDLAKPFVYVALNFQPERTTSPMGGFYVHQYLMVDLLSKLVPPGWQLVVKEHPTTFTPSMYFRSQAARSYDFYDDMAALPNVTLASMHTASFDLIDHSQAVATVTGTVGWEAINRGKPVLIFGYPWYRGGEGVFQISSAQSCREALQAIQDGYTIDREKLRLFAYALEQTGIPGYVEAHLKIRKISDQENAALIAAALKRVTAARPD